MCRSASGRSRWAIARPRVMIDLIDGKPVEPIIYTGLDECTQETAETCIAK